MAMRGITILLWVIRISHAIFLWRLRIWITLIWRISLKLSCRRVVRRLHLCSLLWPSIRTAVTLELWEWSLLVEELIICWRLGHRRRALRLITPVSTRLHYYRMADLMQNMMSTKWKRSVVSFGIDNGIAQHIISPPFFYAVLPSLAVLGLFRLMLL